MIIIKTRVMGLWANNKVLDRYDMKNCSSDDTPVTKGDKLSLLQCLKNALHKEQMKDISYASAIESLMYTQICICPDITYTIEKLGKYLILGLITR